MSIIDMDKIGEALNTKADIDLNNTGVFSTSSGGVNLVQSTPSDAKGKEVASADFTLKQGGLDLMDVVFAPLGIDESKNKRRYLNGQVIIQSQFPAFTSAVKARMATMANAYTTETNWQAEKTQSKLGQCGKFVVDDTAGTIRLPCVVNAQGLVDLSLIGGIKSESLPNITGEFDSYSGTANGAFKATQAFVGNLATQANYLYRKEFNASISSSTYKDNAPVQQEAIQYPYCIVVNTGVDEAERPINNYQVNNVYSYGMSQYYKGVMNNNSWLKSAGQWNDGTVYTGMYNWLVEQMNAGVSSFVASTATYTDYDFVINTAEQTFRLPLLNGDESWTGDTADILSSSDLSTDTPFQWTATKNGFVRFTSYNVDTQVVLAKINGNTMVYTGGVAFTSAGVTFRPGFWLSVKRGDNILITPENSATLLYHTSIAFIPAVGNGNLYYYIGDTLQNAQLINVARIEETLVNKTNKVQAAEASMPSGKYIDLTLGASGTTYTAPANGWFDFNKASSATQQYFVLTNMTTGFVKTRIAVQNTEAVCDFFPVGKGEVVKIDWSVAGPLTSFRFYYAQGEQ